MLRAFTAASILALTVTAAQAGPPATDIQYSDLNLSSPSDARVLEARVEQFASKSCDALRVNPTSMFYQTWFKECVRKVSGDTTRRVEARAGHYYHTFARN